MRAAVLGLGVGSAHARTYASTPGARLLWVCDRDVERARRVALDLDTRVAESYEAILRDPETDLISIATYDDQHAEQVLAAFHAGKHVFCEKPLAHTTEELGQIAKAVRGRRLGVNLVLRAAPAYRWLREAIRSGELGEPYAFDGDYLYGRFSKMTDGWRRDVDDYSVLLGGGVHLIDLMLWALEQRPTHVSAIGNRIAGRGTAFRYDDFAAATFRFESGLIGRVTANFACAHRHQHVVRVFGTKKTFIHDDRGPRVWDRAGDDEVARSLDLAALPPSKAALLPDFLESIRSASDGGGATEHELSVAAATIAAAEALRTGLPTEIIYP